MASAHQRQTQVQAHGLGTGAATPSEKGNTRIEPVQLQKGERSMAGLQASKKFSHSRS